MSAQGKPSVLLADDDSYLRDILRLMLRTGGYQVAGEARDSEKTIAMCRKLKPGLLLLDINMPGMGGIEALKQIRRDCPQTRVIMISAEATLARVQEAEAWGAIGFIVKPFKTGRVLDDIAAVLARADKMPDSQ